jgi:hypothetical protein
MQLKINPEELGYEDVEHIITFWNKQEEGRFEQGLFPGGLISY